MFLLASQSPRRKELLALSGWPFRVAEAQVDERPQGVERPRGYVLRLAEAKARTALAQVQTERFVVGADTAVVDGDDILGKPESSSHAVTILKRLRGRAHQVYTAISVLVVANGTAYSDLCITDVPMRAYRDEEIKAYVASGDPLDKAGAYAIQHPGFRPVKNLSGCYANVMGLPLCHLVRTLSRLTLTPPADVPQACQNALDFDCPVFSAVLRGEQ